MGSELRRRGLPLGVMGALGALTALGALAVPGAGGQTSTAGDECSGSTGGVRVEITTTSQERILDRRKLRAEVTNCLDGRARVTLTGKSRIDGVSKRIVKPRRATLQGAPREVGLRLNKRGKRRLARCDAQDLIVRARSVIVSRADKGTTVRARDV